LKQIKIL